jgi:hypothetical protein
MDYSKQIHDFIDGGLDQGSEEQLFYAMSSNEEYREELKEAIRLEKSFKTRLSEMAPSASSTVGVFSKLGIEVPGAIAPAATQAAKPVGFLAKYGQGIISSLGTVALAVVAYFAFLQPSGDQNQINYASTNPMPQPVAQQAIVDNDNEADDGNSAIKTSQTMSAQSSSMNMTVPISDRENSATSIASRKSNPTSTKYNFAMNAGLSKSWANQIDKLSSNVITSKDGSRYLAMPVDHDLTEAEKIKIRDFIDNMKSGTLANAPVAIDEIEDPVIRSITFSQINNAQFGKGTSNTKDATPDLYKFGNRYAEASLSTLPTVDYTPYYDQESTGPAGVAMEIKTNTYVNLQDDSKLEDKSSSSQNYQVTLLYALDENWSIGADVRQEEFYQEVTGTERGTGREYIGRIQNDFTSFSALARYSYNNESQFTPIGQFMFGLTGSSYFTGRLLTGVEYSPSSFFSIVVGVEGSVMRFTYEDKPYYSPKLGFSLGGAIKF